MNCPVLKCCVTTLDGEICPEKPEYEITTNSGKIHLCSMCYRNTCRGSYGERLKNDAIHNAKRITQ